ncbi:MAG: C45 family peptidase [Acidimicrobiia bacterium]|nr:C45 family peptidase [Acidimicrobiia bacterium]
MIRRLTLAGDPAARGTAHGAAFADELRAYTDDRLALSGSGTWSNHPASTDQLLSLAEELLPAHEEYAPDLHAEMLAMATAGGISAAEAVIVGGFTDFVDAVRGRFGDAPQEDNCTAVLVPSAAAVDALGLLGQTWDMHDTAAAHVVLLELEQGDALFALVFTTVGCLGQIGMNEAGICVGINNLTAARGRVGVTWPFVVRKALQQTDLDDAVKSVLDADLAGAHNFLLMDRDGRAVNIEAMPQAVHVTEVAEQPFAHTNHVLDPDVAVHEAERSVMLRESSTARLERARELITATPVSPIDLMAMTRDRDAICQVATPPYYVESCGAAIMRPATGDFWAVSGRPDLNDYQHAKVS